MQAAATLPERCALQADLGHVHRLQEHCLKDRQRAQTVSAEEQRRRDARVKDEGERSDDAVGWVRT